MKYKPRKERAMLAAVVETATAALIAQGDVSSLFARR